MKIKSLLVSMVLLILFMFSGCISDPSTLMKDNGLSSITGAEQLQKMFNDRTKLNRWSLFKGDVIVPESGTDELDEPNYTKTNVQVDGVDEGDVVKTDGERIYSIYQDMLRVVAIKESGAMELLLNECLSPKEENKDSWYYNNTYYYELYITDDYLVAIGQRYEIFSYDYDFGPNKRAPFSNTNMGVIAIYDLESLAKVKEYEVSGSIIASRLIEDDLYLITNYYPWLEANDLRPFTKNGEEIDYFAYQDIKYLTDVDCESYTIVTHLQLDTELTIENDVFLGASSWGYVYVSQSAIYLATMKYTYTFFWNGKYIGQIISYLFDEDGSVMYGGFGNFDGTIINQFAMDEYNDYLRIVTTEGWGKTAKNRLYVYERKIKNNRYVLEVVGKIFEGLGKPGETVKSVRFNGDIATVVTYQQTDPFYTIDLSNPKDPKISGALEIPGFSTYQHPWTDNLVIGIGYDAENGRTTGLKFALYDISDPNNPIEVGEPLVYDYSTYSYGEALYNHKAIMIDKDRGQIGLSLYGNYYYNNNYVNEYLILGIDESRENPIYLRYSLSHSAYVREDENYFNYKYNIERGIRIDDYLYLISGGVITSHNLEGEIATSGEIIF